MVFFGWNLAISPIKHISFEELLDVGTLETGTKPENELSYHLQVPTSFAQKKIVLLICVKSDRNGRKKLEKNYQNGRHLLQNTWLLKV